MDAKIKNIMVAVPDRLGDVLVSTQSLRFLKEEIPELNIDILAPNKLATEVFAHNPYIRKAYDLQSSIPYDLVIDISDSEIAQDYVSRMKAEKISYSEDKTSQLHSAEKLLQFFAKLFDIEIGKFMRHYDLFPQPANFSNVEKLLQRHDQDVLVGFHMGCHGLARKRTRLWNRFAHGRAWPVKKFMRLAQELQHNNPKVKIVLTGSKEEEQLGKYFCKKVTNTLNLIGKTSILDLAVLISKLKLLVSNDTGVMHVACTTDVRLIVLYGEDNKIINEPYPPTKWRTMLRKPKITEITVAEVMGAIDVR